MAISQSQPNLGEYLVREGVITQTQFNGVLAQQRNSLHSIGRILVEMGLITEMKRIAILQKSFGFELANLKNVRIDPILLTLIPQGFAEKHRVVPIRREKDGSLVVGMEDPTDMMIVDAIKNQVGLGVEPVIASLDDIQSVIAQYPAVAGKGKPAVPGVRPAAVVAMESVPHKLLRWCALPVLVLGPLALFPLAIINDLFGFGSLVNSYVKNSSNPKFEMFLYIALVWGLWSIILFEVNGLVFGRRGNPDDDDV